MRDENSLRDNELKGGSVQETIKLWQANIDSCSQLEFVPKWKWFKPPKWRIFHWAYNLQYVPKENKNKCSYDESVVKAAIDEMNNRPEMNQKWVGEPDRTDGDKDRQVAYFCSEKDHTMSVILMTVSPELTPRWSWFKPPKWKIFKWAYRHKVNDVVKFTNCYPSSMKGMPSDSPKEFAVRFTANPWKPPEAAVKKVRDALAHNKEIAEEVVNAKVSEQTAE